jgi:N-acetylglucosamine-6-phosphate deacetylase
MTATALAGARIFDGERLLDGYALTIEGGRIAALLPECDLDPAVPRRRLQGLLAPGFIDVQVNGGGGVLFNDAPTLETIRRIGTAHRRFGTTGFLPTLVSDSRDRMEQALDAVRQGLAQGMPGLLGIHLEGPFLNPDKRGAHDPAMIRTPGPTDIDLLTSLGAGRTLVTLAPECVAPGDIDRLVQAGVILSAGHTAGDYATIRRALGQGLRGFTHLFNAMPPLTARAPGPLGAALEDRASWCGVIADLHHVSAASLKIAISAKGWEKIMLVSDAMSTVGTDLSAFLLQGRLIRREGGRLTTADGVLAGSDLDMATAVRNAVHALGQPVEHALAMASRVPAEFLGLGGELGRLRAGHRTSLVLLDEGLRVRETWIDGTRSGAAH